VASAIDGDIVTFVSRRLKPLGDRRAAGEMAAYMKTTQPFFGVPQPQRAPIHRAMVKQFPPGTGRELEANAMRLWRAGIGDSSARRSGAAAPRRARRDSRLAPPAYRGPREMMYAACAYAEHFDEFHTPARLAFLKRLVVQGGWWDVVDWVAGRMVSPIVLTHRDSTAPVMEAWIVDRDPWVRRAAMLSQMTHKSATDEAMLFDFALRLGHEQDFFIRKAVGWALRQYAWSRPQSVAMFLRQNTGNLSPLTVREAGKNLNRTGKPV
jgi:3-methyladenine DNA glycosylase AlkD